MRDSKELLTHMYDYRVTCSYDEILRFKKSAALAAAHDLTEQGISDVQQGLVQVVSDNFDTDISTPNGKTSTHSLAMIIMQLSTYYEDYKDLTPSGESKRKKCVNQYQTTTTHLLYTVGKRNHRSPAYLLLHFHQNSKW